MANCCSEITAADFVGPHPPHTGDVCKKMGLPKNCKPIAAQLAQFCALLVTMSGVPHVCERALDMLESDCLSASELASKLGVPSRLSEMFAEHLVKYHGVVRGEGSVYGFYHAIQHTRSYIDGLCSSFYGLKGCALGVLEDAGRKIATRTGISFGQNRTFLLQALVKLWLVSNFPSAEAIVPHVDSFCPLEFLQSSPTFEFFIDCLDFVGFVVKIMWLIVCFLFDYFSFPLLVIAWTCILCLCIYLICHYLKLRYELRLLEKQKVMDHEAELERIRTNAGHFQCIVDELRRMDVDLPVKRKIWVGEGLSNHDFEKFFIEYDDPEDEKPQVPETPKPNLKEECAHPLAPAPVLPVGTTVEFFCVDAYETRVLCGCGGVTGSAGDRCEISTSGHVLQTFLGSSGRIVRFTQYDGDSWHTWEVVNPILTKVTPGTQFGSASVCCDYGKRKPTVWRTAISCLRKNFYYYRRGVAAIVKDPVFEDNKLLYKGDTRPGDSGTFIYQDGGVVAIHQGTYSETELVNFASLGVDVGHEVPTSIHDGFAEGGRPGPAKAPTGPAKQPHHAKGHAPRQYVLKAAAYDGNQFGELLDKAKWTALWDYSEHKHVLVVDAFWYISAHLCFWRWDDWVKAGKPRHFDAKLYEMVMKEEIYAYLRGKTMDSRVKARVARLIGRKIYPVPEESSGTHPAGKDVEDIYPRSKGTAPPRVRDLLVTRFMVEHAMKMPANEWGKIANLKQVKMVPRRRLKRDAEGKAQGFENVDERIETQLSDKLEPMSKIMSKKQFFDKTLVLDVYAAAVQENLLTIDQVPTILGQFGAREVQNWIAGNGEVKEWYLHYATGLSELYPESEESEYDPMLECEPERSPESIEEPIELVVGWEVPPFQPPPPPVFRELHTTSTEAITIQRFVQMEAQIKRLTDTLSQLLERTNRVETSEPDVKTALFDLAQQVAKLSSATIGKTVADNTDTGVPVKPPPVLHECVECNCMIPASSWVSHTNGRRHLKNVEKLREAAEMPQMPRELKPESSALKCPECDLLIMRVDFVNHCANHKLRKNPSFLGARPRQYTPRKVLPWRARAHEEERRQTYSGAPSPKETREILEEAATRRRAEGGRSSGYETPLVVDTHSQGGRASGSWRRQGNQDQFSDRR